MSSRVEWSRVSDARGPVLVDPDFSDQYGTSIDPENLGIWMGSPLNSDGAIMEGSPQEWIAYAAKLIQLAVEFLDGRSARLQEQADPDCEVCDGDGQVRIEDGKGHGASTRCWECLP